MALYRTYRPATLDDVVGQDHVTGPLRRALANDRVHHAYLFSGPRGCGKTSTARILARSLNCEQGPTPDPCGVCQSCLDLAPNGAGIAAGESVTVAVELDTAKREVEVPADLAAALAASPAARDFFATLSFSNQRGYVDWVQSAKKDETRLARLAKTVESLEAGRKTH